MSNNPVTDLLSVTLPITANSAYVSGMCVGGLLQFPIVKTASAANGGGAAVVSLVVIDLDKQNAVFTLYLFRKMPAGNYPDHFTQNIIGSDLIHCAGTIPVAAADYVSTSAAGSVATEKAIGLALSPSSSDAPIIYGLLVTTSTPTWTAATNLVLKLGAFSD